MEKEKTFEDYMNEKLVRVNLALTDIKSRLKVKRRNPKTITVEYTNLAGYTGIETLGKYTDSYNDYYCSATTTLENGKKWYSYASLIERDCEDTHGLTYSEQLLFNEYLYKFCKNK